MLADIVDFRFQQVSQQVILIMFLDLLTLKPEVFGIDISDLSLKIVKLRKKSGRLSLASFGETKIEPGIIKGGEIKDENALSEIIKKALFQVRGDRIKTRYAVASLPEERAFLQVIQMPLMEPEEIRKAVYFEAENYVPMPMEKVYLDAQIVNSASENLDHADVLIAAMPKSTVDSYASSFQKSGLKPIVFEIESQAIARSLVEDEKSTEPLLLIDIGATRASFIVFSGYSIRFTTSLLISSQKFTETIADNLKISIKEAEDLKKKYGIESGRGRKFFNILKPDIINLAAQIKKYLGYYQSHSGHEHIPINGKVVKKIILCGGAANLRGLDDFLSRELRIQVVLGNPWSNILPSPLKEVPELTYQESLKYTTALGLALRAANL